MSDRVRDLFMAGQAAFSTDPGLAIESYEEVLEIEAEHFMAHFNLAVLYSRLGLPELGATHLDGACSRAHSDMLGDEMREVFWGAWSAPMDAETSTLALESPKGALPLRVTGYFTADALTAAGAQAVEGGAKGGLFCPQCNGNIYSETVESCPKCGAARPRPPFSWYRDNLLGKTIISGRYTLTHKIDWSGFGVVYRARAEVEEGQPWRAVKLVRSNTLAKLEQLSADLEALKKVAHPAITRVMSFANFAKLGKFCTIMELAEGRSIGDHLAERGPFEPTGAAHIGRTIASALAAAHEVSVFHGSLKPSNVILSGEGPEQQVKILNFGTTDKRDPLYGDRVRSPGPREAPYAAPEQLASPGVRTVAVDLYQLGVVLFTLLTGQRPYEVPRGRGPEAIRDAQEARRGGRGPNPGSLRSALVLMPEFDQLVASLLSTEAADRPASAAEVVAAIDQLPQMGRPLDVSERGLATAAASSRVTMSIMTRASKRMWHKDVARYQAKADAADSPLERAEALTDAGRVYRARIKDPERAADAFEQALDAAPQHLAAFKELTLLHAETERWEELASAYRRMIARLEATPDRAVISVLLGKLGEVLRRHLGDISGAIAAYERALEYHPDVPSFEAALSELYGEVPDSDHAGLAKALDFQRRLLDRDPTHTALLVSHGVLLLRLRRFDAALCVFRVLVHLGAADERATAFVRAHTPPVFAPPEAVISDAIYRKMLGDDRDEELAEVFGLATEALVELFAFELEDWNLRPRDRIKPKKSGDLIFMRLYRQVAGLLGYDELPPVYHKGDLDGLHNGSLYPPGFLVGGIMMTGWGEKEVGGMIAKKMALFSPASYLIQVRQVTDLEAIFYSLVKVVRPGINLADNESTALVARAFKTFARAEPTQYERLVTLMERILSRDTAIALSTLQDSFEDVANRLVLTLTGDVDVCEHVLVRELHPIRPERTVAERMTVVLRWSVDPQYHSLRRELGVAID